MLLLYFAKYNKENIRYLFSSKKEKSTSENKMKKVKKTSDNKRYTYEQKKGQSTPKTQRKYAICRLFVPYSLQPIPYTNKRNYVLCNFCLKINLLKNTFLLFMNEGNIKYS
jgi:hypothetical protein